jgi:hypothetical protein
MNTGVIFGDGVIPKNRGNGDAPDSSYFDLKTNTQQSNRTGQTRYATAHTRLTLVACETQEMYM